MKKRSFVTWVLTVLLLCSVAFSAAAAGRFTDVSAGAWYASFVDYAVEHGIFKGVSDSQFAPEQNLNRAQFVQVLANLSEVDTSDPNVATSFSDVSAGAWYSPAVKWASENGIVNGKGDGIFAPEDNVTRQEMCTMLVRYANYLNITLVKKVEKTTFADDLSIDSWAKDAVYACQQAELVNGVGSNKFNPHGATPRCQGATLFTRFHQYLTNQAHIHLFGEWAVAIPATCLREGEMRRTCACGVYEPKVIPAMGTGAHIEVIDPAVPATETTTGLTEGKHCSICNTVLVPQQTIPKLYDYREYNPLLAENKPINTGISPSFNIDTTGFVKNSVKLADLKGKTLTLITSVKYGTFNYYDANGDYLSEWDWFEGLKDEYGLNIKYIESRYTEAISQILTYMNAGKALDAIPTHRGGFPLYLNLSQPLDPYINFKHIDNSPGVSAMTLEQTRYGGGYRCISPVGTVDVLWYDQSRVEEFGLTDPHTLWEQDKWNWDAWRDFITSAPQTTNSGMKIAAFASNNPHAFAATDGKQIIELDTESNTMNILNNWMDERVLRAITYYESAYKSVQNGSDLGLGGGGVLMVGDVMMGNTSVLMNNYDQVDEYAQNHKVNWVPYPKSPYETGQYAAYNFGYTMMLPKKLKTTSNAPYAVKFMELWATRFTEAMVDYLNTSKFLQFNYEQRKEYFDFCAKNTYFPISMNEWRNLGNDVAEAMRAPNTGYLYCFDNRNLNVTTEHIKVANIVQKAIDNAVTFDQ